MPILRITTSASFPMRSRKYLYCGRMCLWKSKNWKSQPGTQNTFFWTYLFREMFDMDLNEARQQLKTAGRSMLANGLTWGNAGNLSVRLSSDAYLITASGTR